MKTVIIRLAVVGLCFGLTACAGQPSNRLDLSCSRSIDRAYEELDFANSKGFSGSVAWSKAASLLAAAKVQQQLESYEGCLEKAEKARFYIKQSQQR